MKEIEEMPKDTFKKRAWLHRETMDFFFSKIHVIEEMLSFYFANIYYFE